ncbi:MAG: nucleotide exchange factor GrpE [Deltaproteobacteria bacterium]|nr:MAG: nucleotide exchange factor GrpE [Deltaproteobacteria bacterium]
MNLGNGATSDGNSGGGEDKGFVVRDQRWWLRDDVDLDAMATEPKPATPHYVEELEQRVQRAEQQLQEYIRAHKASMADVEGMRKRLEGEIERKLQADRAKLAGPFVEVLDNLERLKDAVAGSTDPSKLSEGVEMILRQLREELGRIGLERIETEGRRFDPNTMEALMTEKVGADRDGMVLSELRSGYMLAGQLVRPAGVKVGIAG